MSVVFSDPPRADPAVVAGFAEIGVATIHEAQGRTGLREEKEAANRARLKAGELGLDLHGMRETLARKGLTYRPYGA